MSLKSDGFLSACIAVLIAAPTGVDGRATTAQGAAPYDRPFGSTRPVQILPLPRSPRSSPSIASGLEAVRAAKAKGLAAKPAEAEPASATGPRPTEGGASAKEPQT
jgi:hypothetical protein